MRRDNAIYLQHILDAITRVEQYIHGVDAVMFLARPLVQDGVIRQIEIIGEAAKQLSPELRNQYPHVPWKDITGMRDKLIHQYFSVDIEAVWLTAIHDLPLFKAEVEAILRDIKRKNAG
jgi:uncharacterized protein with HEPN domain